MEPSIVIASVYRKMGETPNGELRDRDDVWLFDDENKNCGWFIFALKVGPIFFAWHAKRAQEENPCSVEIG